MVRWWARLGPLMCAPRMLHMQVDAGCIVMLRFADALCIMWWVMVWLCAVFVWVYVLACVVLLCLCPADGACEVHMIQPTLIPVRRPVTEVPCTYALPVMIDPIWYGQTMTSDGQGIVHSRSAHSPKADFQPSHDEVIL